MYRVLAARSLKFLEQREEDTISYQRQFKEARQGGVSGHGGANRKRAGSAKGGGGGGGGGGRSEEKDGSNGGETDARAATHYFNASYPDRSLTATSGASYARQVGEKSAATQPLLGYPPKDAASAGPGGLSSSASAPALHAGSGSGSGSAPTSSSKPHATIILHEKKDKSDQLNMRIAAHMDRPLQKSMSAILVDEVVQRRLKKNQRKKAAVQTELDKRQLDKLTPAQLEARRAKEASSAASAVDQLAALAAAGARGEQGQGVWSSLGQRYTEQGGADLLLPSLNAGVPLRELTRSKHARPPPLKESSEHHKRYEALVELFRAQRHRLVQPPLRDGQNGVPRDDSYPSSQLGANSGLLAGAGVSASGEGLNPLLMDLSTDEGGVNPANQSLLARLYQTHAQKAVLAQQALAAQAQAQAQSQAHMLPHATAAASAWASMPGQSPFDEGDSGDASSSTTALNSRAHSAGTTRGGAGGKGGNLSSSASANQLGIAHALNGARSMSHGRYAKESLTSVERIAALQPKRWDTYSVRSLASSASVPNFERRGASAGQGLLKGSNSISLASLPENHPAHTHPHVSPMAPTAAQAKALAAEAVAKEKEAQAQANLLGAAQTVLKEKQQQAAAAAAQGGSAASAPTKRAAHEAATREVHFSDASASATAAFLSGAKVPVGLPRPALDPSHPEYLTRKAETLSIHRARIARRRAKAAEAQVLFEAVMKQLSESRLDHLHRWRNAFDGTKQKMDRLLIKKLVSRAEQRAEALDGGSLAMEPVVNAVLSEQELTEVASTGAIGRPAAGQAGAGSTAAGGFSPAAIHMRTSSYGRDKLLVDDFAHVGATDRSNPDDDDASAPAAPYDEHADLRNLERYRLEEESVRESKAMRSHGAQRKRMMEQLGHNITASVGAGSSGGGGAGASTAAAAAGSAASGDITNLSSRERAGSYGGSRPKHLSGIQHASNQQQDIVVLQEFKPPAART